MTDKTPKFQPTGLRNLRAFLLAKTFSHNIYDLTAEFPNHEFRLVGQMRGVAVSVFGNIAEGYGRNSIGDYIQFCEIARGSLAELGSYMEFCHERQLIKPEDQVQLIDQYNHAWNTLGALIRSLKDKKTDASWDDTYNVVREELEAYDF